MHIIPFLCTSISSSVESLAELGDDRKGTGEPSVTVHCAEGEAGRPRPEKSSTPQRLLDNVCCLFFDLPWEHQAFLGSLAGVKGKRCSAAGL